MDYEVVHIAVAPPARLDEDLVNSVAAVINKSPTHTRLSLAGELPRIIAHAESATKAETIIKDLGELGLTAIACRASELGRLPPPFPVQTLELGEKAILFRDSAGAEKRMAAGDVFLILTGRVESSVELKATRSRIKFSWGATLLSGGIPVWKRSKETTTEKFGQSEGFARLYGRKADEPTVELWQHDLNYSCLGTERAVSSVVNFEKMRRRLREAFPRAILDDRLDRPLALTDWQDVELNCRLIYLFQAMAKQKPAA